MMNLTIADDAYWLKFGQTQLDNAIKSRDDAAIKLDTLLGIIWGIYTSALAVNFVFNKSDYQGLQILLMCLPIFLMPITKYLYVQVQMPVFATFYPEQPKSVQNYYSFVVTKKRYRLILANIFTIVSVLSISLAVASFKMTDPFYAKKDSALVYHGKSEKNADLVIRILFKDNRFFEEKLKTDDKGFFTYGIDLEKIKPEKTDSIKNVYFFNGESLISPK